MEGPPYVREKRGLKEKSTCVTKNVIEGIRGEELYANASLGGRREHLSDNVCPGKPFPSRIPLGRLQFLSLQSNLDRPMYFVKHRLTILTRI